MRAAPVWLAFAVVHAWTALVGLVVIPAEAFHDLDLYRWWSHLALAEGVWPVLDEPWVYPVGALVPILLPGLATTTSTFGYALGWCVLVTGLNGLAVGALLRRPTARATSQATSRAPGGVAGPTASHGRRAALWWLGFLLLLGPVWMGRLDGVVAPLIVLALLAGLRRPAVAATLLTVGAWIKVAPGALLLPLATAVPRAVRRVVLPAGLVTVVVAGTALALGARDRVASFLTTQGDRGLQTESVAATPWVLASLVRDDVRIELNEPLVTFEVRGPGVTTAAAALDVLLPVTVLAVAVALVLARRRGRGPEAFLPGAVVLLVALVVVNKVGSPQFLAWIGAGVAALVASGLVTPGAGGRAARAVAPVALVAAALTQVVFPWGYLELLAGDAVVAVVLAVRNALLVALLVLAAGRLRAAVGPPADLSAAGSRPRAR